MNILDWWSYYLNIVQLVYVRQYLINEWDTFSNHPNCKCCIELIYAEEI